MSKKTDAAKEHSRMAPLATEARLQHLLDHLPDIVFALRLEPLMLEFISPSCERLLGYAPSELVGHEHAVARIVHCADLDQLASFEHTPPRAGRRVRFVDRAGQVLWMEVRASVVSAEGRPPVLEGVARDVTESHRAELAQRRLLMAIEQSAEAVVLTDVEGRVEYVNPAYRRTTGIAASEALGQPWSELEVRGDRRFLRSLRAVFDKGEGWHGRTQSLRAKGGSYDEDVTVSPIVDDVGALAGVMAVKRDITQQLALEEQLHQAQKMEAVGQLAGGIAHDFNNLLHVIQGHTVMMQALELSGSSHAHELAEMLSEVDKAAERAAALVRQLLAFSRRGGAEHSEISLDVALASLHGRLQELVGPQIQLALVCEAGKVDIVGNWAQLEQVVINLCINARDAMPPGGYLRLSLGLAEPSELGQAFRGQAGESYVRLTVQDDGSGMTREVQRRLYEPFFTTKRPGEGIGLGLATAYAIVQAHRGFIDSTTTPGRGTIFNIYLPRLRSPEPAPMTAPDRGRVDGHGLLALVAEDEPAVLQLTSVYLRQSGFEVIVATNGPEAERLLAERGRELDLAVLDAVMPGFGGQGVHRAMRDQGLTAPVIFVTGYDDYALGGGMPDEQLAIVRKPFSAHELLGHVARLLGEPA